MNRRMSSIMLLCMIFASLHAQKPQVLIALVIDQFAYHYLDKIKPHTTKALHHLLTNGINFTSAIHPHGKPGTAPGHVALNTGTFAKYHGIVDNSWYLNGRKTPYEDDTHKRAAVFMQNGEYLYGASPKRILVDGISDHIIKTSNKNTVYSVSYKARAAIGTAGKLGKAIWFDTDAGVFTSSHAYFDTLPAWLKTFNERRSMQTYAQTMWKLRFTNDTPYDFFGTNNYFVTSYPFSLINLNPFVSHQKAHEPMAELFKQTPQANKLLLELAANCLNQKFDAKKDGTFMLWVCLSPLDTLGHRYGPDSKETLDMLYHLDRQLQSFMDIVAQKVAPEKTLYILTADHGVMPIPELLNQQGPYNARRIFIPAFIKTVNHEIEKLHKIRELVTKFKTPACYLNKAALRKFSKPKQKQIITDLKKVLETQPGIKKVWTKEELLTANYPFPTIESYYQNQVYPNRGGDIICQVDPYCLISKYRKGTAHRTPYECDTHIPLVLYQSGSLEKKTVHSRVYATQLANTLAHLLELTPLPKPAFNPLPI